MEKSLSDTFHLVYPVHGLFSEWSGASVLMTTAGTLTRADLSEALHRQIGLSRSDSAKIVEQILARHHVAGTKEHDPNRLPGQTARSAAYWRGRAR